jgi:hypothetical protein
MRKHHYFIVLYIMDSTCALAAAEASHDFKGKIGAIGLTGVASATGHSDLSRLISLGLYRGTNPNRNCRDWTPNAALLGGVKTDEDMMKKVFQFPDDRVKQILVDDDLAIRGGVWRRTNLYVSGPDLHNPVQREAKHMFIPRYLTAALACPTTEDEYNNAMLNGEYLHLFKIFSHTFRIDATAAVTGSEYDGGGLTEQNNQVFVSFDQAQQVFASKKNDISVKEREHNALQQQLHVNIVFGASSFSDPGPTALPDAKPWTTQDQSTVKAYPLTTWTYSDEVPYGQLKTPGNTTIATTIVPAGDSLSLSAYEIKTDIVINNDGKYISNQVWTDPSSVPFSYQNSAAMSAIKSIAGRFANIDGDYNKSRELQTKRVGDYFQVRDTKNLPDNAINEKYKFKPGNTIGVTFPEPPDPDPEPSYIKSLFNTAMKWLLRMPDDDLPTQRREWYRKRTFFFTGDWMAFLCAAHNEVNCVYVNSTPGGTWDAAPSDYDSPPVQGLVCLYFE